MNSPKHGDALSKIQVFLNSVVGKLVLIGLILSLVGITVSVMDFEASLHLDNVILTGPAEGFYNARGEKLSSSAEKRGGKLNSVATEGSVDNIERLSAAIDSCDAQFAMVQTGMEWPGDRGDLELIGRFPRSESVFFVGQSAGEISQFSQLQGLQIGIGPKGSGTAHVARQLFENTQLRDLNVTLVNLSMAEQEQQLFDGTIPLGVFVIDEDAEFMRRLVADRGLQLASFEHLDVLSRSLPYTWVGRVGAGQYDPIVVLPSADINVLRIDTLVIGNGCASHSETVGLLRLLTDVYPGFMGRNQEPNTTGLPMNTVADEFYRNNGVGFVEQHFPWVIDIMPLSNWVYVAMVVSVLFNLMGVGNRFRLWRIDANRFALEEEINDVFGPGSTVRVIEDLTPTATLRAGGADKVLAEISRRMRRLRDKCRNQSTSILVPMGAEMAYRYQEHTMGDMLDAIRDYRVRMAIQFDDEIPDDIVLGAANSLSIQERVNAVAEITKAARKSTETPESGPSEADPDNADEAVDDTVPADGPQAADGTARPVDDEPDTDDDESA